MKKVFKHILLLLAVSAALAACKKWEIKCTYVVRPYNTVKSVLNDNVDSVVVHQGDVIAWATYGDTLTWRVESYDDAQAGLLTNKSTGEQTQCEFNGSLSDGQIKLGPLVYRKVILICVDRDSRIYAWRPAEVEESLSEVYAAVTFNPFKTTGTYTNAKWVVVNETPPSSTP